MAVLYTTQSEPIVQSFIALLLPGIKLLYRHHVTKSLISQNQDLAIAIRVFEVEFFQKLYSSVFLQTATNDTVLYVLAAVDLIESSLFLYRTTQLAKKFQTECSKTNSSSLSLRRMFWRTELVVLVELMEVVTPLLLLIYLSILRKLPSVKFVESVNSMSDQVFYTSMWNLALYVGFEMLSFTVLISTLTFRFDLPVFSQMGYFIQENKHLILPMITLWVILAISTSSVHFGVDFSFSFDDEKFLFV